ncbi:MAG: 30S ribosomal protein S4 [Candidatus Huberarchaeum crystalense]|uniref:30S ribosomal protein S4 n=3 Tax=Huberarchaeum crystalense TaxID=2014257 RepID=A0A2H9RDI2_HUBC1|nr:30S ribosomal protein S4 [archaeon]OIP20156.1 MAG: 30S ribosomal protein S4 [archaeon CG2_30_31_98]PIV13763.1 MAG: 30S ribosomal protein S4 [Candidatus Huberarchaeum crystalense]PIV46499.1 MAG: 30S ribosomal protein S4 [Candidatus Huberarchaeum crystalense]PIV89795.1 MAG: 30S ribosomal protein S4 [Candidatus Huberarchaeum crystalense]
MGLTRKSHKIYLRPTQKWDKARIAEEKVIVKTFGLKNKKEIYVAQGIVKKIRDAAKRLIAQKNLDEEAKFLTKIKEKGYISGTSTLGDVLDINVEKVLSRRLQTVVFKHKIAKTIKQARQSVTHRKIKIKDKVIDIPSYPVTLEEEKQMTVDIVVGKPQVQKDTKNEIKEIKQETETKTKTSQITQEIKEIKSNA